MGPLDMNQIMRQQQLTLDPRSTMGVFSRGKPVYKGGSNTPNSMDLRKIAQQRLLNMRMAK